MENDSNECLRKYMVHGASEMKKKKYDSCKTCSVRLKGYQSWRKFCYESLGLFQMKMRMIMPNILKGEFRRVIKFKLFWNTKFQNGEHIGLSKV